MHTDHLPSADADQARQESPFLTTNQAGTYVGLSRRTLEKMRTTGDGPPYRKHGRYIRYHVADLEAWSASRRKNSTSEEDSFARSARPVTAKPRRASGSPRGKYRRHT